MIKICGYDNPSQFGEVGAMPRLGGTLNVAKTPGPEIRSIGSKLLLASARHQQYSAFGLAWVTSAALE